MFPQRNGWIPKFKKSKYPSESQPKRSSFRSIKPNNRSFSATEDQYFRKRQKPHVLAGMFANAKSSVPVASTSNVHSLFDKHSTVPEAYSESPRTVSKFSNYRHADLTSSWDFSDVSARSDRSVVIPSPQRLNSDEEHQKVEEKVSFPTTPLKKPLVPWLRKFDSSDETSKNLKPKKIEPFEYPDGFEETIDSFSSRLDQIGALPSLALQNHTDTTMGKVEKTLIAVALTQTKDKDCHKSLPLYDSLVERSDWLIFQEEFNDDNDYLPKDPFYTHDVVSSDFEEYMQEKEVTDVPSYTKIMSSASEIDNEYGSQETPKDFFGLFKEGRDSNSQDDFFGLKSPSTSEKKHEKKEDHFPMIDQFCSSSTPVNKMDRKRKISSFTPRLSPSTKRQIQTVRKNYLPAPQTSSEYSPFNFNFLSSSSPSSPEKSQPKSKYSIW